MSSIDTMPREFSGEEAEQLAAHRERLETLSGEAELDDPSEEALAEIDRIEADSEALTEEAYRPEDIARAGAFVALGHGGKVRIERGYLRPEDADAEGKGKPEEEVSAPDARPIDGLSGALVAELTAQRTAALRNDLAQHPDLALIAVAHALAARTFYHGESLSCLEIAARHTALAAFASGIDESAAGKAVAARHEAWAARMPNDGAALWSFVGSLSVDDLQSLLAHCASLSLDVVQRQGASQRERLDHASELAKAMPHDMSRYWQPTVTSYLGRVSKEHIVEAVREGAGDEAARQISGLKKQTMAARAEQLLAGRGWLPPVLAASAADGAFRLHPTGGP